MPNAEWRLPIEIGDAPMELEPINSNEDEAAYPTMEEYRKTRGSILVRLVLGLGITGVAAAAGYQCVRSRTMGEPAPVRPPTPTSAVAPSPALVKTPSKLPSTSVDGTRCQTPEGKQVDP